MSKPKRMKTMTREARVRDLEARGFVYAPQEDVWLHPDGRVRRLETNETKVRPRKTGPAEQRRLDDELLAIAREHVSDIDGFEAHGGLRDALRAAYAAGEASSGMSADDRRRLLNAHDGALAALANERSMLNYYRTEYGILVDAARAALEALEDDGPELLGLAELVFDLDDLEGKSSCTPLKRARAAWRQWRRVAGMDALPYEDAALTPAGLAEMPERVARVAKQSVRPAFFWDWLREVYLAEKERSDG